MPTALRGSSASIETAERPRDSSAGPWGVCSFGRIMATSVVGSGATALLVLPAASPSLVPFSAYLLAR